MLGESYKVILSIFSINTIGLLLFRLEFECQYDVVIMYVGLDSVGMILYTYGGYIFLVDQEEILSR